MAQFVIKSTQTMRVTSFLVVEAENFEQAKQDLLERKANTLFTSSQFLHKDSNEMEYVLSNSEERRSAVRGQHPDLR